MHDSEAALTLGAVIEQLQRLAAEHGQDLELVDADGDAIQGFTLDITEGTVAVVDRHDEERRFQPPRAEQALPRGWKNLRLDDDPDEA